MTLKKSLVALSLVLLTMVSPLSAKDGNKTIKTKINNNVYLKYYGAVENKEPVGNGTITVYRNDVVVDEITGAFNKNTITDAIIKFKGGNMVFKGSVEYITSETEIVYKLSNGFFEIKYSQYKDPLVVPVENMSIHRNLAYLDLSNGDGNTIVFAQKDIESKRNADEYNDLVGVKPVVKRVWTVTLHLSSNGIKSIDNIEPISEDYIDYYELDYGEKGRGVMKGVCQDLRIICSNGDSLRKIGNDYFTLLRNIDGGKLELNRFYYKGNFDIGKAYYDKDKMPLVDKFYVDMPDEYKKWIGTNVELDIYDKEKQMFENGKLTSHRYGSQMAVEVMYSNGDTWFGTVYENYGVDEIKQWLSAPKLPEEKDYYSGLYTTKHGEKTYYLYGYPGDKYIQLAQQKEKSKKLDWEKKQQDARNEYLAREKAANDRRLAQEKKYGKNYVDAIYDDYSILVGTPEGLLKEQYFLDVNTETPQTIVYNVKRTHNVLFIVWVNKSTHKVDMVTNLQ